MLWRISVENTGIVIIVFHWNVHHATVTAFRITVIEHDVSHGQCHTTHGRSFIITIILGSRIIRTFRVVVRILVPCGRYQRFHARSALGLTKLEIVRQIAIPFSVAAFWRRHGHYLRKFCLVSAAKICGCRTVREIAFQRVSQDGSHLIRSGNDDKSLVTNLETIINRSAVCSIFRLHKRDGIILSLHGTDTLGKEVLGHSNSVAYRHNIR